MEQLQAATQSGSLGQTQIVVETPKLDKPENAEYFGEALAAKGPQAMQHAIAYGKQESIPVRANFDADEEFPADYGLAIRVLAKAKKEVGVVIMAIPDVGLVAEDEQGADFIHRTVLAALIGKAVDSVRPRGDDVTLGSAMPLTIAQFVAPATRGEGLGSFNELSKYILPTIKKSVPTISKVLLRQAVSNRQFAEHTFPKIPQETWVGVLNILIKLAAKYKEDAQIFNHWLATRDSAVVQTSDIDLGALDALADLGNGETEENGEA